MYVEARILQIQVFDMKHLWGCLNRGFSNDGIEDNAGRGVDGRTREARVKTGRSRRMKEE